MSKEQIQELRRLLNQANAVIDAGVILAGADTDFKDRLREIRSRLIDEREYLEMRLLQLRLPAAGRAY